MVFLHEKAGSASPSPTVQRNSTPKASKRKSTLQRQFPSRITKRKPPCKSLRLISAATLFLLYASLFTITYSLAFIANATVASPLPCRAFKNGRTGRNAICNKRHRAPFHNRKISAYQRPVEPKPPSPRRVSGRSSVSSNAGCATGTTTSWAMRSPWQTVRGSLLWL